MPNSKLINESINSIAGSALENAALIVAASDIESQSQGSGSDSGKDNDDSSLPTGIRKITALNGYEDDMFADTFPVKLFNLLKSENKEIIEWLDHGESFRIIDIEFFANNIIPKYFKQTKLSSFQRQLNLYGFKRILKGVDKGAYFHPQFHRDRPNEVSAVKRVYQKKGDDGDDEQQNRSLAAAAGGVGENSNESSSTDSASGSLKADSQNSSSLVNNFSRPLFNPEYDAMIRQHAASQMYQHPYHQMMQQQQQQQYMAAAAAAAGMHHTAPVSGGLPAPLGHAHSNNPGGPSFPTAGSGNVGGSGGHPMPMPMLSMGAGYGLQQPYLPSGANPSEQQNMLMMNNMYFQQYAQQMQLQHDYQMAAMMQQQQNEFAARMSASAGSVDRLYEGRNAAAGTGKKNKRAKESSSLVSSNGSGSTTASDISSDGSLHQFKMMQAMGQQQQQKYMEAMMKSRVAANGGSGGGGMESSLPSMNGSSAAMAMHPSAMHSGQSFPMSMSGFPPTAAAAASSNAVYQNPHAYYGYGGGMSGQFPSAPSSASASASAMSRNPLAALADAAHASARLSTVSTSGSGSTNRGKPTNKASAYGKRKLLG